MKKIMFSLFYISIIILVMFIGCSKDNSGNPVGPGGGGTVSNEAKLTLNGGSFVNQAVTLSNGTSTYSTVDTATAILFSGKLNSDSLYFFVVFQGKQTGVINWNDNNGVLFYKKSSSGLNMYIGSSQGSTTISSYGSVGSKVDGSVTGKIIDATTQTEVNISGNFSSTRTPDIN